MMMMSIANELWLAGEQAIQLARQLLAARKSPGGRGDYYPYGLSGNPRMSRISLPERYVHPELYPISLLLSPEQRETLENALGLVEAAQAGDVQRLFQYEVELIRAGKRALRTTEHIHAFRNGPPKGADPDEWQERYGYLDLEIALQAETDSWRQFLEYARHSRHLPLAQHIVRLLLQHALPPTDATAHALYEQLREM